ncbi:DUF6461 domain-containing protein [Streptomyces niveus]|uniref:DUF6461 domain-containing protein n=1 Tax=Streptomyces niveus TaxID=193462 RepID=UPI0033E11457
MTEGIGNHMHWAAQRNAVMWCVTFTDGITPEEVLTAYGFSPDDARTVDWSETLEWMADRDRPDATVFPLRFGRTGEWSFCFEKSTILGSSDDVLARLSATTETISVMLGGGGVNRFGCWRDGREVESFEPGHPRRKPAPPHPWWDAVHERIRATGERYPGMLPVLEVVAERVGAILDDETLDGQLHTVMMKDPYR